VLLNLLSQASSPGLIGIGAYEGKFFTLIAGDNIGGALNNLIKFSSDFLQTLVPSLVAISIVVTLKVIDITEQQGQGLLVSGQASPFLLEPGVKMTTVGGFSQAVYVDQILYLPIELSQFPLDLKGQFVDRSLTVFVREIANYAKGHGDPQNKRNSNGCG